MKPNGFCMVNFPRNPPYSCPNVNGLDDPIEDLPWGKDVVVSGEDVPSRFRRSRHGATTCCFWVADADGENVHSITMIFPYTCFM